MHLKKACPSQKTITCSLFVFTFIGKEKGGTADDMKDIKLIGILEFKPQFTKALTE